MLAGSRHWLHRLIAALAAWELSAAAWADSLGQWDGFDLRLDTDVRVSLGFRTEDADPALLANINADDGDRAFVPGLNSERVDVVSEFTAERGALGFDVSGQGWYDAAYNTRSANNSPQTFNPLDVSNRWFAPDVRDLMGKQAELLNAYARDTVPVDGVPVTVSIGRQTLLWGESLLFPENGIAASMAPVDEIKSLSAPLAEAREVYLPVAQIAVRAGLGGGVSLEGYDQFEWRRDRLPGVGSFFSTTDILDQGGQRYFGVDGFPDLYRSGDVVPHGIGQFGLALRQSGGDVDWGIYALRADARSPSVAYLPADETYHLYFPRGIGVFGASLSGYAGDTNIAAELSLHQNTPLDSSGVVSTAPSSGGGAIYAAAIIRPHAGVPQPSPLPSIFGDTGTTVNGQVSVNAQLPPNKFAGGMILRGELAGNDLLRPSVPAGRTALALAARAVMTLQYFHVLPGLDVTVPLGFGLGLAGRSAVDSSQNAGAGFVSAGVAATYHVVWQASLSLTHFVGGAGSQPLADRDFAILSATRSF
jgi:hypothetical protein